MILQHPLHGERYVVVAGPLAVARACDRILARMMRPPVRIDAGGRDSDRLAFEHRKGHRAEIEHDVVGVVVAGPTSVTRTLPATVAVTERVARLRPIEIGVRTGGGPGRDDGGVGADVERGFVARTGRLRSGRHGKRALGTVRTAQFVGAEFRRQSIPAELRLGAVGPRARHCAPIVDAAGRARRHAGHAQIADVRVDHIVARIVGDRADRADRFAGVATDADFGVDQVLPDDLGIGGVHHGLVPVAMLARLPAARIATSSRGQAKRSRGTQDARRSLDRRVAPTALLAITVSASITPGPSRRRPFRPCRRP